MSMRAGTTAISSSKSLGSGSNASSSSCGSRAGSASEACQETGEEGSAQPPPGLLESRPSLREASEQRPEAASAARDHSKTPLVSAAQRLKVPAGVEQDFEPRNWLSDASIGFASSRLAEAGGGILGPAKRRAFPKSVMFMDPTLAFWLTMQDDSQCLDEAKTEMKLPELELLLCPINDTHNACTADAGCHWSLLVCWCSGHESLRRLKGSSDSACALTSFRYYDSASEMFQEKGIMQADELANRLLGKPVDVEIGRCAQQTNFYDCGVYVLLFCEIIATAYVESRKHMSTHACTVSPLIWEERLAAVTPEEINSCRSHYYEIAREGSRH